MLKKYRTTIYTINYRVNEVVQQWMDMNEREGELFEYSTSVHHDGSIKVDIYQIIFEHELCH